MLVLNVSIKSLKCTLVESKRFSFVPVSICAQFTEPIGSIIHISHPLGRVLVGRCCPTLLPLSSSLVSGSRKAVSVTSRVKGGICPASGFPYHGELHPVQLDALVCKLAHPNKQKNKKKQFALNFQQFGIEISQ